MLHGVYPEILHFVQDDERRVQHDPLTLTLSPRGERIISTPHPRPLGEGRVRECNEVKKKQTIFSLEEQ
jgi:hypothetical protein